MKRAPFHKLFVDKALLANVDYRCLYKRDDLRNILEAAEADMKARSIQIDEYVEAKKPGYGNGGRILDWYANGPTIPKDRPGLIAMLHPQFHKRGWDEIAETAEQIAKELKRWIWVVEAEASRWHLIMIGDAPTNEGGCPEWKKHVRGGDQYIAVINPKGEWKVLGAS